MELLIPLKAFCLGHDRLPVMWRGTEGRRECKDDDKYGPRRGD